MSFSATTAQVHQLLIPRDEDRVRILDYVEDPNRHLSSDEAYALVDRLDDELHARGKRAVLVLNFEDLVAIGHDFSRLDMMSTVNRWVGYEYYPAQIILSRINDAVHDIEVREMLDEESGTSAYDIIRSAMEDSVTPMAEFS